MKANALMVRTRRFAVRAIRLVDALPKNTAGRALGSQFVRCATSVGANYHVASRARSKKEFIAKLGISLEEADECLFWLMLVVDADLLPEKKVSALLEEANELTAILTASIKTAKSRS